MTVEQVVAYSVPEDERLEHIAHTFGARIPLQIEPLVFVITAELAPAYIGGYWEFYALSNGGFYMAPASDGDFAVICENGFVGTSSADALGVTACLYAYSHLSFSGNEELAQLCAKHYHWLRDFMMDHPGATRILGASD